MGRLAQTLGLTMTADTSGKWLYRIFSFDRLVKLIRTNKWFFAHPSEWDDPYERRHTSELTDRIYAQCWCRNGTSDAMWRIYSPDKLGIRIRVSSKRLQTSLLEAADSQGFQFRMKAVEYLNPIEELAYSPPNIADDLESKPAFYSASDYLFRKRLAFVHENETRITIRASSATKREKGVIISLPTRDLIESVLVDPRAPDEFVEAYKALLAQESGFNARVQKSQLYREAQKREA